MLPSCFFIILQSHFFRFYLMAWFYTLVVHYNFFHDNLCIKCYYYYMHPGSAWDQCSFVLHNVKSHVSSIHTDVSSEPEKKKKKKNQALLPFPLLHKSLFPSALLLNICAMKLPRNTAVNTNIWLQISSCAFPSFSSSPLFQTFPLSRCFSSYLCYTNSLFSLSLCTPPF